MFPDWVNFGKFKPTYSFVVLQNNSIASFKKGVASFESKYINSVPVLQKAW